MLPKRSVLHIKVENSVIQVKVKEELGLWSSEVYAFVYLVEYLEGEE